MPFRVSAKRQYHPVDFNGNLITSAGSSTPKTAAISFSLATTSGAIAAGKLHISIRVKKGSGTIQSVPVPEGYILNYPPIPEIIYPAIAYTIDVNSEFEIFTVE